MEITTTMVVFQLDKEQVETQTDKAVLLVLLKDEDNADNSVKEWVPLSKIELEDSATDSGKVEAIMPKWLFYKKELMPMHIKTTHEFTITTYADKHDLLAAAQKATIQ